MVIDGVMDWGDASKNMKRFLNQLFMDDNKRMLNAGWVSEQISGPNGPYSTSWERAKQYGRLTVNMCEKAMEEFYPGKNGHALNFMISYGMGSMHILGKGGEQGHEYPAEIHEPAGKPFIVNQRPMKREELDDFRQKFVDGLEDFPDQALGSVIRQDLDGYHVSAMRSLSQDWKIYNPQRDSEHFD